MDEYIERTEKLLLAMNAGARAIENTKRYHGAVYTKDVFSESPQEIPYLQAAKVLREVSDAPAADVVPVVHGRCPICSGRKILTQDCDNGYSVEVDAEQGEMSIWQGDTCLTVISIDYCPNCGAKMDGGDEDAAD
jgi:hypothetical protein